MGQFGVIVGFRFINDKRHSEAFIKRVAGAFLW